MKDSKENEVSEREIHEATISFFKVAKKGFFKRNYFNLFFLLLFAIAIFSVSFNLVDLVLETRFGFLSFLFILMTFLYSFISILTKEILDKEIDRYCNLVTDMYLEDVKERIQDLTKKAEVVKLDLEKEENK